MPTQLRLPAFRGRIGEDVLYAGFAGVTPAEAVGSPVKADNKAGLFFLLSENPGDPRFGLDPDGGTTPPTRATLSWAQLTLPAGASYATLAGVSRRARCRLQPGRRRPRPPWPTSSGSVPSGPSCTRRSWCDPPPDARRSDPPAAVLRSRHHRRARPTTGALRAHAEAIAGAGAQPRPARRRAPGCGPRRRRSPRRAPRLDQARRTLDLERLRDLEVVFTISDLLGAIPGSQVLGLFPVTLEARLDPGRLRIRVWPDAISTSTHDPRLTPREHEAAQQYWRAEAAATSEADSRAAWRALAAAIGVTRAAWAAQQLTPTNRDALGPGVEPQFPPVALQDDDGAVRAAGQRAARPLDRGRHAPGDQGARAGGRRDSARPRRRARHHAERNAGTHQPGGQSHPAAAADAVADRLRAGRAGGDGVRPRRRAGRRRASTSCTCSASG